MKKRVDMPHLQELLEKGYTINKLAKIYNCTWDTVKRRIYENKELVEDDTYI